MDSFDVFLSHSSKDNVIVRKIYDFLLAANINIWLDLVSIRAGMNWRLSIEEGLRQSSSGLVVLSKDYLESAECLAEWNTILADKKPLFIAQIDDTPLEQIPARLRILQIVKLSNGFEAGLGQICEEISRQLPAKDTESSRVDAPVGGIIDAIADLPQSPPEHLYGRETVLNEIMQLLEKKQNVLLQGFPGIGKTACALWLAKEWMQRHQQPALWLEVGKSPAQTLLDVILRRLSKEDESIPSESNEKRRYLMEAIRSKRIGLLILDDVWDGGSLHKLLQSLSGIIPVLISSRSRFPIENGRLFELAQLSSEASLQLLNESAARSFATDSAAPLLCEKLGYLPFALEIAGKLLKSRPVWSAQDLLENWDSQLFKMRSSLSYHEDERSDMAALIQISLDAILKENPAIRKTLDAIGALFEPSFTVELLSRIISQESYNEKESRRLNQDLLLLHDYGLIQMAKFSQWNAEAKNYYRTHRLVYDYLHDQSPYTPANCLQALVAYVEAHCHDFAALDIEQANLFAGLAFAAENKDGKSLRTIFWQLLLEDSYFESRGVSAPLLHLIELTAQMAEASGEAEQAHYLWSKLGNLHINIRQDIPQATQAYQKALELARSLKNAQREAILLTVLIRINYTDMDARAQEYERIRRENPDIQVQALILNHLGYLECERQNFSKAHEHFAEQVRLAETLLKSSHEPDKLQLYVTAIHNQGSCEYDMGQYETALVSHQQALKFAREHNLLHDMANALQALGEDYEKLAEKHLREALQLFKQVQSQGDVEEVEAHLKQRGYEVETLIKEAL